ncbi:kinase-like domain-containing protein [Nemania abortiva]|nr:kinase-like domain-containing protein [Nemania abortiva]
MDKQNELITTDKVLGIMRAIGMPLNGDDERTAVSQIVPPSPRSSPTIGETSSMSRRKLFAIVVMLGEPENILSFIREGIWDEHLPLRRDPTTREWERRDNSDRDKMLRVACFKDEMWSPSFQDLFEIYQWYFLPPFFDMGGVGLRHYPLRHEVPLPFIEDEPHAEGGFGQVRRVKVHRGHHNLASKDLICAVKRLKSTSKDDFDREVEALSRFRDDGNPHLVKLLATYHDGKYYHLMFPLANGDLRDHWRLYPSPKQSYEKTLWIAEQCFGIAEALRKIRNDEFSNASNRGLIEMYMKGRHGDVKPENILLFPSSNDNANTVDHSQGVLALSDFGHTRFHRDPSANQKRPHTFAVSWMYRAPEYDLGGEISPAWDIWSLGCVYLEFIVWYLQGWEALSAFLMQCGYGLATDGEHEGYFYRRRWSILGPSRKGAVIRRIEQLQNHPNCTRFVYDLLQLINQGMICIRPKKRMDCADVAKRMKEMLEECRKRPAYCTKPGAMNESDKKLGLNWASKPLSRARTRP